MPCRRPDLASEHGVADYGVEQHQREDEEALAPEHEGETGMRGGGFLNRDREWDHVGPERDRQCAERRHENQRDHVKWHSVPTIPNTRGRHHRRDCADRREDKKIRPLDPSVDDPKVLGQSVTEHDHQKSEQSNRENRNQTIGRLADIALAFPDQPASPEQGIAEAQADTAQYSKGTEPSEFAAGILAVDDRQLLYKGADGQALHERGDEGASGKARIPDPPQTLGLTAIFERHSAQDQARQHQYNRQIKGGEKRRVDDRKGPPQHHSCHNEPRFVAIPDRRHRAHHRAPPLFAAGESEEAATPEIKPVEQHVKEDAHGQYGHPEHDHGYSPAETW